MRDAQDEIDKQGARLVVIGNGRVEHAAAFRKAERIQFDLWVDPEMKAYRAAGLRRGLTSMVSRRSPGHLWRALKKGLVQTKVEGDPWQLGGVFVITQEGKTAYQQVSREAGDHAPLSKVLKAIDRVAPGEGRS